MILDNLNKIYNDNEKIVLVKESIELNESLSALIDTFSDIDFMKVPENTNEIEIGTIEEGKYGIISYSFKNFFVKTIYVSKLSERMHPYWVVDKIAENYNMANELNIQSPEFYGVFTVKSPEEGYIWNGIISENLSGYHILDEDDEKSYNQMIDAIELCASKKLKNKDMHFSNIMTNGVDWKLIDFDRYIKINEGGEVIAKIEMAEHWKNSLTKDENKAKVQSYIDSIR